MDTAYSSLIEDLYIEMYDMLISYGYCHTLNVELAEEAVQETFRVACQKPAAVCGSCNPQGWIFLTMQRVLNNSIKVRNNMRKALGQFLMNTARPSANPMDMADIAVLYGDFAQSEDFKLLVEMAIHMKSYEQMARDRGISTVTCRKRVQRAKERFKKFLGNDAEL